jgi:hypothetical protein
LHDHIRRAQVDETFAQLYLSSGKYDLAERSINLCAETLEVSGEDAFLAEALTTKGLVLCKLEGKTKPNRASTTRDAFLSDSGDLHGAGRALLIMIEEMCDQLADDERREDWRASQSSYSPTPNKLPRVNGCASVST